MDINNSIDFEGMAFSYIDEFKFLISPDKWSSAFLDYSKNELMVLLFLYRSKTANMTEISKYINAPLNTTTGVVSRLEKKKMIDRIRSKEDRRIVEIVLTDKANEFINKEKKTIIRLLEEIYNKLTDEEKTVGLSIVFKIKQVLDNNFNNKTTMGNPKKIKRIIIE
jgi:DNA-binding MarR family transcriptional regulator